MKKFVRVMDGLKSNAGRFEYKLNEVNIAKKWNPNNLDPKKMGGFNFGTEDKILRWLHRGETIYDVTIPEDAEIVHVDQAKGIYRTNKIIISNPRIITDDLVIELYNKSNLSNKVISQCLVTLLWKNRINVVKYIIKDRVNNNNINKIIKEYENYIGDGNFNYNELYDSGKEIYDILKEIQSKLDISLYIDKDPYIRIFTDDKIINITGQSGSGKTTYANKHYNNTNYLIVDTDEIFSEERYKKAQGINKDLGKYFRKKYEKLPNCGDDFDLIYKEILDFTKKYNKTIVIDCAQFHCIKDIGIIKGKLIVLRTCIDTCYDRVINRFKCNNPKYTKDELNKYKERKEKIYTWYKYSNIFIENVEEFIKKRDKQLKKKKK